MDAGSTTLVAAPYFDLSSAVVGKLQHACQTWHSKRFGWHADESLVICFFFYKMIKLRWHAEYYAKTRRHGNLKICPLLFSKHNHAI